MNKLISALKVGYNKDKPLFIWSVFNFLLCISAAILLICINSGIGKNLVNVFLVNMILIAINGLFFIIYADYKNHHSYFNLLFYFLILYFLLS